MKQEKIPESLLAGLNGPQQEAVRFKDGPLLVLAGPGSGTTRVVTHRIAALLHQGVWSRQIAALTFTNKAADEMKARLDVLAPDQNVWIGTFHRFCASLLRQNVQYVGLQQNFTIYDADESLALLKTLADKDHLPPGVNVQKIASAIGWAKNNLVLPEDYDASPGSLLGRVVEEIYPAYQKELQRANAVDFDDLLLHVAVLLRTNPEIRKNLDNRFRYILVDEYQDTNTVQYVIAKALSQDHRNLAVTGDPDQSIYGWRGANIQNILDFEKDFPDVKIIRLEQNYRSTPEILAVADHLIENNIHRKEKKLFTDNPAGKPVRLVRCADHHEEADSIAREIAEELKLGKRKPSDYAIFYRMNALSRNLEHALRREAVPFQLVRGLEFFNRKEIKDLVAYLRVVYNPSDTISLGRIINEPARGIGKTTFQKISDHALRLGCSTMDAARDVAHLSSIAAKTRKAVQEFVAMVDRLAEASGKDYPIEALLGLVLKETKYKDQYDGEDSEEDQERLDNIAELLTEAHEFDERPLGEGENALEEFLEQVALVSDVDELDRTSDRVSLMTLHAAKGLEFPVVYLIAIEEGILPHDRSSNDAMQLEEERRLFFVGITRAEEELRLSRAARRDFRGMFGSAIFSRFLAELPKDERLRLYDSPSEFLDIEEIDRGDGVRLVLEKPLAASASDAMKNGKTSITESLYDTEDIQLDQDNEEVYVDDDFDAVDPEYDDDGNPIVRKPSKKKKKKTFALSLTTAARLHEEEQGTDDWKKLEKEMLVRHAVHGMGVVKDFWGKEEKRRILVEFFSAAGWMELEYPCDDLVLLPGKKR